MGDDEMTDFEVQIEKKYHLYIKDGLTNSQLKSTLNPWACMKAYIHVNMKRCVSKSL